MEYILTGENGEYFVELNESGKVMLNFSVEAAKKFETIGEAKNMARSLFKSHPDLFFRAEKLVETEGIIPFIKRTA